MPWTPAQHRLFEAAAHNKGIAKKKGISQSTAARLAKEGIANEGMTAPQRKRKKQRKTPGETLYGEKAT